VKGKVGMGRSKRPSLGGKREKWRNPPGADIVLPRKGWREGVTTTHSSSSTRGRGEKREGEEGVPRYFSFLRKKRREEGGKKEDRAVARDMSKSASSLFISEKEEDCTEPAPHHPYKGRDLGRSASCIRTPRRVQFLIGGGKKRKTASFLIFPDFIL